MLPEYIRETHSTPLGDPRGWGGPRTRETHLPLLMRCSPHQLQRGIPGVGGGEQYKLTQLRGGIPGVGDRGNLPTSVARLDRGCLPMFSLYDSHAGMFREGSGTV
jgi:hypothetical protein